MDFDDILKDYVGEFGLYQILILIFVSSFTVNALFNTLDSTFTGVTPEFWCLAPGTHHLKANFSSRDLRPMISPPLSETSGQFDSCLMYNRNYSALTVEDVNAYLHGFTNSSSNSNETHAVVKCTSWDYSQNVFQSTIATEWDLVCNREWLVTLSQSIYMAGKLTEAFFGYFSDRFGRRTLSLAMIVLHIGARTATGFAYNFQMYMVTRVFMSIATTNWYTCIYVLCIEMVGPKYRTVTGQVPYFFWSVGYVFMAGAAYLFRDWRQLTLFLLVFGVPYLLHFCLLPESVRWLIVNGRDKTAAKTLRRMAEVNRKSLPKDLSPIFQKIKEDNKEENKSRLHQVRQLVKSWKWMRITLTLFATWFALNLTYFGLVFHLPKLAGDIFLNTLISGGLEIPALILVQFTIDSRLGRKLCCCVALILTGVALIILIFIPKDLTWVIITLAMIGRFGNAYAYSIVYIYTVEMYPTTLRNLSLSLCGTVARIAGVIAPFVILLTHFSDVLPPVLFGLMSLCVGIMCLLLPETRGQHLKDAFSISEREVKADKPSVDQDCNMNELETFIDVKS